METANFNVIEGNRKILISAAHAYPHRRPILTCGYKVAEEYTDEIAREICSNLGCCGIYLTSDCEYDPNYHKLKRNEYKQKVKEIIEQHGIQRFVDIHGLRDYSGYDVGIYYTTRFKRSIDFAERIAKGLDRGALKGINIGIFRFFDNEQQSLGEFVASKLWVPAVQIEIERYIRKDDELKKEFVKNIAQVLMIEKI